MFFRGLKLVFNRVSRYMCLYVYESCWQWRLYFDTLLQTNWLFPENVLKSLEQFFQNAFNVVLVYTLPFLE